MADEPRRVNLGWVDRDIPIGTHMCFYYSDDRGLRETLSFLRVGLDEPQTCCVIFADTSRFESLLGWLSEGYAGSLDPLLESNKLMVIGGSPTTDELVSSIGGRLDKAMADGYRLIRFLGFIGWGKPGWPDEAGLLEFERRVNEVVTAYPATIICTYGVPHLTGSSLIYGGLQTHPVTMIGDEIRTNPHYRP
ncbi:MAG: MEDS domain-containing protein [Candidatus Dormibacteraceae bacterium]